MVHACRPDAVLRRRCVSPRNCPDLLWFACCVAREVIQGNGAVGAVSTLSQRLAIGTDAVRIELDVKRTLHEHRE